MKSGTCRSEIESARLFRRQERLIAVHDGKNIPGGDRATRDCGGESDFVDGTGTRRKLRERREKGVKRRCEVRLATTIH